MSVYTKIDRFYDHSANLGNKIIELLKPVVRAVWPILLKFTGLVLKTVIDLLFRFCFVWMPKAYIWCSILLAKVAWKASIIFAKIAWKASVLLAIIGWKITCFFFKELWLFVTSIRFEQHSDDDRQGNTSRNEKRYSTTPTRSDTPMAYAVKWNGCRVQVLNARTFSPVTTFQAKCEVVGGSVCGTGKDAIISLTERDSRGRTYASTWRITGSPIQRTSC